MIRSKPKNFSADNKWLAISILTLSLAMRWILIFRGGQYYNSDETRYEVSLAAARLFWQGRIGEALQQFTISPEHLGFKILGLIPALTEHIAGPTLVLPALFFSFFSVLNLYLIFLLSRATSRSSTEPLFALIFAASSQALLYYSRHLFPYDMSLAFGLLALYLPLAREQTLKTSFLCGVLSFLCFITYNGYWPLAGFAMLAHTLMNGKKVTIDYLNRSFSSLREGRSPTKQSHFQSTSNKLLTRLLRRKTARNDEFRGLFKTISSILRKGVVAAIGFIAPLALLLIAMLISGTDMIAAYQMFSTSITQGVFEEGWSIPFEYFWHTEYLVFLILGALAILAIIRPDREQRKFTWLWGAGFLFIYLCLVIPSSLEYFVVYARLARPLLPFLILLAAQGLTELEKRIAYGRRVTQLILMVILIQAAWNFHSAFRVGFPRDFAAEVQVRFPEFEFSSKRLAFGAPVICQHNGYVIENTKFYVEPPESIPQVRGQRLLSAPHPTTYLPYLYEGDPPEFREAYHTLKLKMNFYKADPDSMSQTNPEWTAIASCLTAEP